MTLKFDEILLLLVVLESLDIKAADEAANKTKPNILGRSTLIASTGLSGTLGVPTEWADSIITLHETHVVEGVTT
jgi:hypothetical protein